MPCSCFSPCVTLGNRFCKVLLTWKFSRKPCTPASFFKLLFQSADINVTKYLLHHFTTEPSNKVSPFCWLDQCYRSAVEKIGCMEGEGISLCGIWSFFPCSVCAILTLGWEHWRSWEQWTLKDNMEIKGRINSPHRSSSQGTEQPSGQLLCWSLFRDVYVPQALNNHEGLLITEHFLTLNTVLRAT